MKSLNAKNALQERGTHLKSSDAADTIRSLSLMQIVAAEQKRVIPVAVAERSLVSAEDVQVALRIAVRVPAALEIGLHIVIPRKLHGIEARNKCGSMLRTARKARAQS